MRSAAYHILNDYDESQGPQDNGCRANDVINCGLAGENRGPQVQRRRACSVNHAMLRRFLAALRFLTRSSAFHIEAVKGKIRYQKGVWSTRQSVFA